MKFYCTIAPAWPFSIWVMEESKTMCSFIPYQYVWNTVLCARDCPRYFHIFFIWYSEPSLFPITVISWYGRGYVSGLWPPSCLEAEAVFIPCLSVSSLLSVSFHHGLHTHRTAMVETFALITNKQGLRPSVFSAKSDIDPVTGWIQNAVCFCSVK
jgi:hypothetical protein